MNRTSNIRDLLIPDNIKMLTSENEKDCFLLYNAKTAMGNTKEINI